MLSPETYEAARHRYESLLREAERERLIRWGREVAKAAPGRGPRLRWEWQLLGLHGVVWVR